MAKIVFVDEVTPKAYLGREVLNAGGCGGTEITVVLTAEGLAKAGHKVTVLQHSFPKGAATNIQHEDAERFGIYPIYMPIDYACDADYVVCLRAPQTLIKARERWPNAKLILWCHDLWDRAWAEQCIDALKKTNPTFIVGVSNFHKLQMSHAMQGLEYEGQTRIRVCYPPLPDELKYTKTNYDKNQLCWLASPHKGLDYALEIFKKIHEIEPGMKFVVHNPGYFKDYSGPIPEGVVIKPPGSYWDAIETVRNSLCLFAPNVVFPETFGRIFTEADMVGTPALTHALGAIIEVVDHPDEIVDCNNPKAVIERVFHWRNNGRPTVRGRVQFGLRRVINSWLQQIFI